MINGNNISSKLPGKRGIKFRHFHFQYNVALQTNIEEKHIQELFCISDLQSDFSPDK